MMKKMIFVLVPLLFGVLASNAQPYDIQMDNKIYMDGIASVQLFTGEDQLSAPVGVLGEATFHIAFDDLNVEVRHPKYTFIHCTHDWQPSQMNQIEYIEGFMEEDITQYDHSFNTIEPYLHYHAEFPNENISFSKSGNYILFVYDDSPDNPILTRRFMVVEPLPAKVIDTGMGFERLVRTLQGKQSNYDTDVFQPIIKEIGTLTGKQYGKDEKVDIAMRVVADHIRTIAFSITDGQLPSNAKAGYVIRRILRRAVRYAYTFLGQKEAFLYKLLPVLIDNMGDAYPELGAQKTLIEKVIIEEEESFLRTLDTGIKLLDKVMADTKAAESTEISGVNAFTLYDTYGFPLDLTELILRENGMTVNIEEFNAEMAKQKARARNAAAV